MTPLFDDIARLILDDGSPEIHHLMILVVLRPLGLLYGFSVMGWGLGKSRILRTSIGLALGLPMLGQDFSTLEQIIHESTYVQIATVAFTEIAIGYVLGLLASLPFFVLQFSGAITDAFRGETDSGIVDAEGEPLNSFSSLYLIIGLSVFFMFGGLWQLVANLYQSYGVWPVGKGVPELSADASVMVFGIFSDVLLDAVVIAVPLLAVFVAIEFLVAIASRTAMRLNLDKFSFPLKNIIAMLSLPVLSWFIWLHAADISDDSARSFDLLRMLFE